MTFGAAVAPRQERALSHSHHSQNQPALACYISAHGYGHGVRATDIIRAFHRIAPSVPIIIVSDLPRPFLESRLSGVPAAIRPGSFDLGMVQLDSIRVDVDATLAKAIELHANWETLVATECAFLRANRAGLVLADIPGIPLEAAARAGISGGSSSPCS